MAKDKSRYNDMNIFYTKWMLASQRPLEYYIITSVTFLRFRTSDSNNNLYLYSGALVIKLTANTALTFLFGRNSQCASLLRSVISSLLCTLGNIDSNCHIKKLKSSRTSFNLFVISCD